MWFLKAIRVHITHVPGGDPCICLEGDNVADCLACTAGTKRGTGCCLLTGAGDVGVVVPTLVGTALLADLGWHHPFSLGVGETEAVSAEVGTNPIVTEGTRECEGECRDWRASVVLGAGETHHSRK